MRTIARFMDARNTAEGKFLSVLLSVLLVFSFLNVTMFTDYANAEDETAPEATVEETQSLDAVDPAADEPEEEAQQDEGTPEQEQPESEEPAGEVNEIEAEELEGADNVPEPVTVSARAVAPLTLQARDSADNGVSAFASNESKTVGDKFNLSCSTTSSRHSHSWKTSNDKVVKITSGRKDRTVSLEAVGSGSATVYCGDKTSVTYDVKAATPKGTYTVYLYTLLPGIDAPNTSNPDASWNGMGTGSISGVDSPADGYIGKELSISDVNLSLPDSYPNITVDGVSYKYAPTDSANASAKGYYTIE